jgi:hypothetical protein
MEPFNDNPFLVLGLRTDVPYKRTSKAANRLLLRNKSDVSMRDGNDFAWVVSPSSISPQLFVNL